MCSDTIIIQVLCDLDPSKGSISTVAGKDNTLKRPHAKYLKFMMSRCMLFEKIQAYGIIITKGDNNSVSLDFLK